MASVFDVLTALVNSVAAAVYPNGTSSPSVTAHGVQVYAGFPVPAQITPDLAAKKAHISVYPLPAERPTTRYTNEWRTVFQPATTLVATASDPTVTLSGTITAGNMVALLVGNKAYAYVVQAGDTLNGIAATLAALVAVDYPGTAASGPVVTATAPVRSARTGSAGTALRNIRQTQRQFQITVWAPTYEQRRQLTEAIEPALCDPHFLDMPDTTKARIIYSSAPYSDSAEKVRAYRADLVFNVDYSLTQTQTFYPVLVNVLSLTVDDNPQALDTTGIAGGIVVVDGTQQMTVWVGPDQPTTLQPWLWLQTDKPLSDPSYQVIAQIEGP